MFLIFNKYGFIEEKINFIVSYSNNLELGTIFKGVFFKNNNNNFFCIYDIFYYKGNYVEETIYKDKFNLFVKIFENDINQISFNKNYLIIGTPIISKDFKKMKFEENLLNYKCQGIIHLDLNSYKPIGINKILNNNKNLNNFYTIFKIEADINPDTYLLFTYEYNKKLFYKNAFIASYEKSKFMNSIFRKYI